MKKVIKILCLFTLAFPIIKSNSQNCDMNASNTRRVESIDMTHPYSYIVQMTMKRGRPYYGTSFFIHPRVLLTAGHNLRKRPQIIFTRVKELTIRVGATNVNTNLYESTFETTQDENIFTNHDFNRHYSISEDFGLIILPDSSAFKKAGGYFKLTVFDSTKLKGKYINIAGYPQDHPFCTQWKDSTQNFFFSDGDMRYDFTTDHGESGAPIWYNENNQYCIFGIHIQGDKGECGTATLITQEVYNEIVKICLSKGIDITK